MKILLVENDEVDAERVIRITDGCGGFSVIHERSLAKAVPVIAKRCINVVLLDLGLSDCDCLEAISALSDLSDAPVIVLSGAPEEAVKNTSMERGAFNFLSKSDNLEQHLPEMLAAAIHSHSNF